MSDAHSLVEELMTLLPHKRRGEEVYVLALEMALHHPEQLPDLVQRVLAEYPRGGAFFDMVLSYLLADAFPDLVKAAVRALETDPKNEAAQDFLAHTTLQFPAALHPWLDVLFELEPNAGSYRELWPWRESGTLHLPFLQTQIETSPLRNRRTKAWLRLLETRHPDALDYAVAMYPALALSHPLSMYLHGVGIALQESWHPLYPTQVYHLCFPEGYIKSYSTTWPDNTHPTWHLSAPASPPLCFGGIGGASCTRCARPLAHLITFAPLPKGLPVSGLSSLSLEVCFACLSWEIHSLFYQHDAAGKPRSIGYDGPLTSPEFPAAPLLAAQVHLAETPPRWKWQDWGLSHSKENLHRVGGYPCWVQSAEYLPCPSCARTMSFLMQLDTYLPAEDGGEWMWGSGGIGYVQWCNACKVSGFVLQDT